MAILSLVGKSMHKMIGIAGRMFSTLAEGNVNIEMISQGASEINISCVIDGKDATKALNLVHRDCLHIGIEPGAGASVNGAFLFLRRARRSDTRRRTSAAVLDYA